MVRIAYLILAHDRPAHLQRLVQRLAGPSVSFFVHIDAKVDQRAFASLAPVVTFCTRRINGAWGDMSLVEATLELMKVATSASRTFDQFVLLSGACYPLQTPGYIDAFLTRHRGTEFIEVFPLPDVTYNKPIERIARLWIRKGKPLARLRWPLQRLLDRILPLRDYKKVFAGRELVTGSQWWCLSGEAVQYILDVTAAQPAIYRFCKFVDCPDEFYFQVILWNSPFRASISHSLTYTDWLPGKTGPEPVDASYLPTFARPVILDSVSNNCPNEKREVLFARKLSNAPATVLDAIDGFAAQRHARQAARPHEATYKVRNGQI